MNKSLSTREGYIISNGVEIIKPKKNNSLLRASGRAALSLSIAVGGMYIAVNHSEEMKTAVDTVIDTVQPPSDTTPQTSEAFTDFLNQ